MELDKTGTILKHHVKEKKLSQTKYETEPSWRQKWSKLATVMVGIGDSNVASQFLDRPPALHGDVKNYQ